MTLTETPYRYVIFKGKSILIYKTDSGLWKDGFGTVWAIEEDEHSKDPIARCGVAPLTLPEDNPLTAYCKVHDYMYGSLAYQVFHTREEADKWLRDAIKKDKKWWSVLAYPFYWASRLFGKKYWENEETNF